MPPILRTPGNNCGAQFSFTDLLQEKAEIEVWSFCGPYIHNV